jgi:heterodisulfide reductase subunit B
MKYAFFVGCTTLGRLPGYEKSARKVAEKLGVELVDMPGSSCCGTTYMESLDRMTALALAARNIAIAEEMGLDIITICNGCTETLTKANKALKEDPKLRAEVNGLLKEAGKEFKGTVEIKHYVKMLKEDVGFEKIKSASIKPFKGLKVSAHYGCHLLKPTDEMMFEDPNNPEVLDNLIRATGSESIDYPGKTECCAGPVMGIREKVTWDVGLSKVETVKRYGEAMVTCCPFCYITYERCQFMSENNPGLPIVHIPQLLGLAMGLTADEVGLMTNKVDASPLLARQEA